MTPYRNKILASCFVAGVLALPQLFPADTNVLFIIADDLGTDVCPIYPEGTSKPPMPNVATLAAQGVTFTRAWGSTVCTPSRASALSGRYGFRTGVQYYGNAVNLDTSEPTIAKGLLTQRGIASGAFGKWHMSRIDGLGNVSAADHPIVMGFEKYAGRLTGQLPDYYAWTRTVNDTGLVETNTATTTYATTDVVNQALTWINSKGTANWFAWVAFNAPHSPYHKPPNNLHSYDSLASTGASARLYYEAMCESLDTEIGRLLSGMSAAVRAKTMIVLIGDNGTPGGVKSGGYRGSKGFMYEGGVRVPMIVSGARVVGGGRTSDALVNLTDIFATVMAIHGIPLSSVNLGRTQDTVSLLPYIANTTHPTPRWWVYTDYRNGTNYTTLRTAIRSNRWKLIRVSEGSISTDQFFNLADDPLEANDLAPSIPATGDVRNHYNLLTGKLEAILASQ